MKFDIGSFPVFTRESSYCFLRVLAIAILSGRPFVCLYVCHTGGLGKSGAS